MKYDCQVDDVEILQVTNNVTQKIPAGVKLVGAPLEWPETKAKGIKVAVLDTGIPMHTDIKVIKGVNFTNSSIEIDMHGHSTHVCGTIAANGNLLGVAPEVELYTVKVLNDEGKGAYSWIAQGIDWCVDNGIHVINMSLGGSSSSDILHQAIKRAYDKGIVIVTSAGNSGGTSGNTVGYPAKYPECIATAAVDINKIRGSFSSFGEEVEIASPGVQVYSTYLNNQYALLNGTSMSAPHLTGVVALLQAKSLIRFGKLSTPEQIRYSLKLLAEDLGDKGHDSEYGFGVFSFGRFETVELIPSSEDVEIKMVIDSDEYIVNGEKINYDVAPIIHQDRTLVPIRIVSEQMGLNVNWDGVKRMVTITGKKYNY